MLHDKKQKRPKKADPRKIELVCLKNRYGINSYSAYFDYYPRYDLFVERRPAFAHESGRVCQNIGLQAESVYHNVIKRHSPRRVEAVASLLTFVDILK